MKELIDKLKKYFLSPYKRRSLEQRNKSKYLLYVNLICTGFLLIFFIIHLFIKEGYFIILGQLFGISLLSFSFYFLKVRKIKLAGNFTTFSLIAFCFFSFIINDYHLDSIHYQRIYESLAFILVGLFLLSLFAISKTQIFLFSILSFFILLIDFLVIYWKLVNFPSMAMWVSMVLCLLIFGLCTYLAVLILNKSKELIIIAERESSKSRLKYNSLFRNMDDGFLYSKLILNSEGQAIDAVFTESNSVFEKLCGYKKIDFVNKKVSKTYPEIKAYFDNWKEMIVKMNNGNHLKYTVYNTYNKQWVKVQAYSPQEGYFVMIIDNITDIVEKDRSTIETQEKFNAIVNSIKAGVIVFDNNKILEINNIIENLLGFSKSEIIEMTILEIVDKSDHELFTKSFANNEISYLEMKLNKKDGTQISVKVSGQVISIEDKIIHTAIIR